MNSNAHTVTAWQSGRLAPEFCTRRLESVAFGRQQWLGAALLVLSAIVMALFVAVLEKDVDRGTLQHQTQRSRAVAEARCEAGQPADQRGRCIALFNGDVVAAEAAPAATPDNTVHAENDARASTVSLLTSR